MWIGGHYVRRSLLAGAALLVLGLVALALTRPWAGGHSQADRSSPAPTRTSSTATTSTSSTSTSTTSTSTTGTSATSTSSAPDLVTLRGHVLLVGCQRTHQGRVCRRPFAQALVQVLANGRPVAQAPADQQGAFSVRVAPGRYLLAVADARTPVTVPSAPVVVTVRLR